MTKYFLFLLAVAALILAGCQSADEPAIDVSEPAPTPAVETEAEAVQESAAELPAVPGDGIDAERYAEHLATLSSDEFEGRAPGTRGERLTLNYLVKEFSELGLKPGYGDSYLQPVPMVELTNEARSEISINDNGEAFELTYPEQMIIGSRRPGTEAHGVEDSELVFVGYGIVAPEYDWNDYAGLDVEGKTVVILVNDPGYATGDPDLFNGNAMTYYGRWTYKYDEAARQGAAAALIIHETAPASYGWDVVINSWSGAQFGLGDAGDEPIMALEGWVTREAAEDLFARAGLDLDEEKARAESNAFTPVSLNGKATASVRNSKREGMSYNVLASIPGSTRPEEAVVYMAHWDHLGRNLAIPGSAGIYNGAIDNASGTAALLEIARLFQQAGQPERTVLFLAVTLEEYGLLGSRYYVNNPVFPPAQTAAAINMDAMTLIGPTRDVVVVGHGSSELEEVLARAVAAQGREMVPEPTPEAGFYYRSDHFNFARGGIPALYAKGGVDHREHGREYGLEQAADYTANRYHKPGDEFNPDWDFRGVVEDLELLYVVGRDIADSDSWPNWYPGNEFRALRDAQRP
jgi:Zn-dependent M28 family amino/carboxypeptidase